MDKCEGLSLAVKSQQSVLERVGALETALVKNLEQPAQKAPAAVTAERQRSYASMLKNKLAKAATPVEGGQRRVTVAVYPVDPDVINSDATKAMLQAAVNHAGLNVRSLRRSPKAGLILEVEGEASLTKLKSKLPQKKVHRKKKMPRVLSFDTPADTQLAQVLESLQHLVESDSGMREAVEETRVCFAGKEKNKRGNLVVELHPAVRQAVLRDGRLFIGWSSCGVRDFLVSSCCYQCQTYGHVARHCRDKAATYSYCASSGQATRTVRADRRHPYVPTANGGAGIRDTMSGGDSCPERARATEALIRNTDYVP